MKQGLRQSMAWLHTWSGLLVSWLLFLVFLAGTASYFRPEISQYARPEIAPAPLDQPQAAAAAQRFLLEHARGAESWFINLPDVRDSSSVRVFWRDAKTGFESNRLDPVSGEPIEARETRGGDFFYRLHFDLHYMSARTARIVVGICAMFMLVAIVSGVITHKKIFKDFFTFRSRKGQRSWLDAHNILAVLSLPFHLVITYSGLVTLMLLYMPWAMMDQYGDERQPFFDEVFLSATMPEASGREALTVPIEKIVAQANQVFGAPASGQVQIMRPLDAASQVSVRAADSRAVTFQNQALLFAGDGELLRGLSNEGAATQTRGFLYGLHLGRFADDGLRVLLFLAGLGGTAMIGTGLVLWTVKRERPRQAPHFGQRLVAGLNRGVIFGVPLAMAGWFLANRLLPVAMPNRSAWEEHIFFIVLAGALLHGLLSSGQRAWARVCALCAIVFAGLPVVNAVTTERGVLASIANRDGLFLGFDLTFLLFALLFAFAARRIRQWQPQAKRARRGDMVRAT